jgi:hypothetical protein
MIRPPFLFKKDLENTKENLELEESTQEAQNGLNRQRKEKNSNFSKLSENGIIKKSALQYFQGRKQLVKLSYRSKCIHGQSLVNIDQSTRDESAFILLASSSVQDTWHT